MQHTENVYYVVDTTSTPWKFRGQQVCDGEVHVLGGREACCVSRSNGSHVHCGKLISTFISSTSHFRKHTNIDFFKDFFVQSVEKFFDCFFEIV